jgi:hypothetical protein
MFESWVSERKNSHLRNALLLRKAGDYTNASKELIYAADIDKDEEAGWVLHQAYETGGFGLYRNYSKCLDYPKPQWKYDKRNPDLTIQLEFSLKHYHYSAECGNAHCQWRIACCQNGWYKKACEQKHQMTMRHICSCFVRGCIHCLKNFTVLDIARMHIESQFFESMCNSLQKTIDQKLRLQELYIYGHFLSKDPLTLNNQQIAEAVNVYTSTFKKAQNACIYWLWVSKEFNMIRDLRQMIGQIIWESRTRPEEWGNWRNNKKQKC